MTTQGRNHGGIFGAAYAMLGRICPPGWIRVKVTENLGATEVVPDAPVDTSLHLEASPYVTTSLRTSWTRFLYDGWCYRCIKQKQLRLLLLVASVRSHRNVRVS